MSQNSQDKLDSWKAIAAYVRRDVSTVRRWEMEAGMPVYRVGGGRRHGVFAYRTEIDLWMSGVNVGSGNVNGRLDGTVAVDSGVATVPRHSPEEAPQVAAPTPEVPFAPVKSPGAGRTGNVISLLQTALRLNLLLPVLGCGIAGLAMLAYVFRPALPPPRVIRSVQPRMTAFSRDMGQVS